MSDNRDELKKLFKRLISKRVFSEECAISLPHRLICSLLQLTSSEDERVRRFVIFFLPEGSCGNLRREKNQDKILD